MVIMPLTLPYFSEPLILNSNLTETEVLSLTLLWQDELLISNPNQGHFYRPYALIPPGLASQQRDYMSNPQRGSILNLNPGDSYWEILTQSYYSANPPTQ